MGEEREPHALPQLRQGDRLHCRQHRHTGPRRREGKESPLISLGF